MVKYVLSECQEFIAFGLPLDTRGIDVVTEMHYGKINRVYLGLHALSCVQECKERGDVYLT